MMPKMSRAAPLKQEPEVESKVHNECTLQEILFPLVIDSILKSALSGERGGL